MRRGEGPLRPGQCLPTSSTGGIDKERLHSQNLNCPRRESLYCGGSRPGLDQSAALSSSYMMLTPQKVPIYLCGRLLMKSNLRFRPILDINTGLGLHWSLKRLFVVRESCQAIDASCRKVRHFAVTNQTSLGEFGARLWWLDMPRKKSSTLPPGGSTPKVLDTGSKSVDKWCK